MVGQRGYRLLFAGDDNNCFPYEDVAQSERASHSSWPIQFNVGDRTSFLILRAFKLRRRRRDGTLKKLLPFFAIPEVCPDEDF